MAFLGYDPAPIGDGLAARLNAVRRRLGLTLAGLGVQTGFDEGSLTRWLNQSRRPSARMEGRLGVALDQLEGRDGNEAPTTYFDLTRWRRTPPPWARPQTFGERLRARRLELGLSQGAVGKRMGVSRSTLHGWEQGRCMPAARHVRRLKIWLTDDGAANLPRRTSTSRTTSALLRRDRPRRR